MPSHNLRSSLPRRSSLDSDNHSVQTSEVDPSPVLPTRITSAFPDSLPNSPIIDEPPPYRRDSLASFGGSLSPTSVGAPSLRRPTVPDLEDQEGEDEFDFSPKTQATPSLRRPTVPDLEYNGEEAGSPFQGISQTFSENNASNMVDESPTSPRRPSDIPPDHRPISQAYSIGSDEHSSSSDSNANANAQAARRESQGLRIPIPERPTTLHSVNSSTALLGDASGPNTPTTPFTSNPFGSNSLAPTPEPSSPVSAHHQELGAAATPPPQNTDSLPNPPQIRVNSIPNTPESADIPSFTAPFASSAYENQSPSTVLKKLRADSQATSGLRKGSIAQSVGSITSFPGNPNYNRNSGLSAKSTALSIGKANIAERRSQRMKNGRHSKKDRESFKPSVGNQLSRKPFQSTRLKGDIYKPWLEKRDPALRWARWITIASIILGFALAGFLCYNGYASVPSLGKTCLVLDDDFSKGLDTNTWQREVRLDGYGHGSFEWTTNSDNNSFVQDGILYLVPTLTSDHLGADAISNGYTLNLTTDGTCTSTNVSQCVAVSNSSRLTVINPVMSARLITKNTVTLKYGKVEVRAKFPTGDWLWPSIHMLPVNETYGAWPRSGEIDILTGRGNNASYPNRGVDYAQSDLHWGPTADLDRLYMTWGYREQRRTYYNQKWHTFGLEWNDKYMWTYIDSRVSQVISLRFNKQSFFERGKFPSTITNTTTGDVIKLINPWLSSEENVAPFDQPFYLVLDLAVGGIDGWFPDGEGGKPWLDNSGTAMSDFWNAKDKWWNNWPKEPTKRGFAIDSVKMWKKC